LRRQIRRTSPLLIAAAKGPSLVSKYDQEENGQDEDREHHKGGGVREHDFELTDLADRKKIVDLELLNRIHCPILRPRQDDQQAEEQRPKVLDPYSW